jgi:aryl-alcohol dehydrogenase-like predicted oxidoreductase
MNPVADDMKKSVEIPPVPKRHGRLALGCWAMGADAWGRQEDEDSLQALREAVAGGMNHLDTAEGYGNGHSEKVVGQFLSEYSDREKIFLATKGFASSRPGYTIAEKIDRSLQRLQTDYVDLYYIHWPRQGKEMSPFIEALQKAKDSGKIRAVGVSNFTVEQMQSVRDAGKIDVHQLCYNLFWRYPERDLIPYCIENEISVVTYSSLAEGTLTGKFPKDVKFEEGDHRGEETVYFEEGTWPKVYAGVEKLKQVADQCNLPVMYLGIQWLASRLGVKSILIGARNAQQARQNAKALDNPVDEDTLHRVDAIGEEVFAILPDTGNIFRFYP